MSTDVVLKGQLYILHLYKSDTLQEVVAPFVLWTSN
jgi:hypothetical protein